MNDNPKDEYLKYFSYTEDDVKYLVMSWKDVCFVEDDTAN